MSNAEILKTAQKGNDQEKYFLFTKIIENTTDILKSLSIFNVSDQKKMDIPELQWNL